MPRRVLALDLGMHTLRAAVLESSLREGLGVQLAQLRRDPDQPLAEQIQELCTDLVSAGTSGISVVSCLPGDAVSQRFLSLPFSRPQQIGQVVPFELENLIPFSVDEVVVDFQIVEHTPDGVRVLAAAVPSHTLAEHQHWRRLVLIPQQYAWYRCSHWRAYVWLSKTSRPRKPRKPCRTCLIKLPSLICMIRLLSPTRPTSAISLA